MKYFGNTKVEYKEINNKLIKLDINRCISISDEEFLNIQNYLKKLTYLDIDSCEQFSDNIFMNLKKLTY